MGFFKARLLRQPRSQRVEVVIGDGTDAMTIEVSGQTVQQVASQATADGREVIVGIRPEHLQLAGDSQSNTLYSRADVVEHLGNEQLVYLKIAGAFVPEAAETQGSVARLSSNAHVQIGQALRLAVDASRLHIFDPATTNRFV